MDLPSLQDAQPWHTDDVQRVRRGAAGQQASAEADGQYLPAVIGDVETFKLDLLASIPDYTASVLQAGGGLRVENLPLPAPSFELHMVWPGVQDTDPAERWLRSRIQMFCADPDSLG